MRVKKDQAVLYVHEIDTLPLQELILCEDSFSVFDSDTYVFCPCKAIFKNNRCFVIWKAANIARKKVRNFDLEY